MSFVYIILATYQGETLVCSVYRKRADADARAGELNDDHADTGIRYYVQEWIVD